MPSSNLVVFFRSLLREPLVVFVLLGAAIFAADGALRRDDDTIRITSPVRQELARSLQARLGRAPEPQEQAAELELWKQGQALYREGMKMGLLERDPSVRAHIAAQLLQIARERDVLPPATDAQLHDFLDRHRSVYTLPAAFDFEQVFVSQTHPDARAQGEQLLATLRGGASPEGLGDWFPRGARFTGESQQDVSALFGEEAAKEMPGYAIGEWHMVAAPRGFHLLRVTAVDRGEPDFDRLRPALALAFDAERRDVAARAFAHEVEGRYRFVEAE
jgi:hypothetical protein